ncbi:HK97-gp10 family putative phage morphogenesis protein [uncultured Brevundimonas sp.]|uniref:HK97-gp10 family putative phage morphogenesis protein n=1 Tax=uncultured Brevundimonas sp. TaxID=213418 RepID=UPI0025FA119A|nr:HK97-gp10 family putative phage morphogenesis protein [uncultured Brevundimonas sp.]
MSGFRKGDRERARAMFKALPKDIRKGIRDALNKNGSELSEAIRRRVPKDTGALAESVGYAFGDAPATSATQAFRAKGSNPADPELTVTVFEGNNEAFYAGWVEYGTAPSVSGQRVGARNSDIKQNKGSGRQSYRTHPGTPAQPHFWPTYRSMKRRMKSRLSRAVGLAIRKALK